MEIDWGREIIEHKAQDEEITRKVAELNKNSEYVAMVKNCHSNTEMNQILEEYGLDIDWFELKRYAMRRMVRKLLYSDEI